MTNFLLLYTGGTMPEDPEENAAVMAAWGAWYAGLGEAVVDGGAPLSGSKNVTAKGVGDGSISSPPVTGYTIISAESLDAAVAAVAGHPHVNYGGQVSVHETFQM
jgi:hypothetical protein